MTLTAPPAVEDPVRRDIDDAVIKEAKRRARRRRQFYGGVLAVVLASVAAFVAWDSAPPPQSPPPAGFVVRPSGGVPTAPPGGFLGRPPEGAVPSAPGDLELQVNTRSKRVWVLADGRMITWRKDFATGAAGIAAAANPTASGYFEQHLSPEGVDLLRSYVVDNATATTPLGGPPKVESVDPLVAMENRIVIASVPGCNSEEGCPRITMPETWLPDSAWTDQQYRPYLPQEFDICYGTKQAVPVERVLAAMPPLASQLIKPQQLVPNPAGWGVWECVIVSTADARIVDQSFQEAEFQRSDRQPPDSMNLVQDTQPLHYVFEVPSVVGHAPFVEAEVVFQPVFARCTRC